MKTELFTVLSVLFAHWVADFVAQTDAQAKGKSKDWGILTDHTFIYAVIMSSFAYYCRWWDFDWNAMVAFFGATFVSHTIIDFATSRLNSKLYAQGEIHWFFASVGFDQFLHYCCLFGTIYLLNKGMP